jgi:hypothetical protein
MSVMNGKTFYIKKKTKNIEKTPIEMKLLSLSKCRVLKTTFKVFHSSLNKNDFFLLKYGLLKSLSFLCYF